MSARTPIRAKPPLSIGGRGSVIKPTATNPSVEPITEFPAWTNPTRIIVLTSNDGVRQWQVEGLASNITRESLSLLADLLELAAPAPPTLKLVGAKEKK